MRRGREKIKLEGTCYVLLQTNKINPIVYKRHDLIWYPERGRTLLECVQYRPCVTSIVTENPWLIACYNNDYVRVWSTEYTKKGEWISPFEQTYGGSVNSITMRILGIKCTIPAMVLDGGESIREYIKELES